jgi:hypothetical protein
LIHLIEWRTKRDKELLIYDIIFNKFIYLDRQAPARIQKLEENRPRILMKSLKRYLQSWILLHHPPQVLLVQPLSQNIHDQNDNDFVDYFLPLFTMKILPFIGFERLKHLGYIWD